MLNELKTYLADKRILILGFGVEGASTYKFLRKIFPNIIIGIADKKTNLISIEEIAAKDKKVVLYLGEEYLKSISNFNFIFKSPGIKSSLIPKSGNKEISSQTDLFLKKFKNQIIGITGTKGKSTCSSLIHHLLNIAEKPNVLIGNIGVPPFEVIDQIQKDTLIVYELSSHMLETVSHSPHISILLNLFQEHLDHYENFEAYKNAKANIYKYQSKDDLLIIPEELNIEQSLIPSKLLKFGFTKNSNNDCYLRKNAIVSHQRSILKIAELNLPGRHNQLNVMAAILACDEIGLNIPELQKGLKSFQGLEHRLEYVGFYNDIHYYNDSIATIPEATIEALKSIPEVDTLILGGFDRGLNYDKLVEFVSNSQVRNILFLGEVGKKLFKRMEGTNKRIVLADSLEADFGFILDHTLKGKCCLLSPAASSYDQFRNFEERGWVYKKLARNQISC